MAETTTTARTMNASCYACGHITIGTDYTTDRYGNDVSGNYANYTFKSAEKLHAVASSYSKVARYTSKGKKIIAGKDYSMQMAKNDFSAYCK
jgi:hypothetical protein